MTPADDLASLAKLSDAELFASVQRLTVRSNVTLAALLAHLGEVEARGLHRTRACASLYTYCIYELRMSEDAAYRRSKAARLVRAYPELGEAIAKGERREANRLRLRSGDVRHRRGAGGRDGLGRLAVDRRRSRGQDTGHHVPARKPVGRRGIHTLRRSVAFAANSGGDSYYNGSHGDDWSWAVRARWAGALLAIPILPSIGRLREPGDATNYRNQWHAARSVMPDMIIVNSWNEYHESTIIEPTTAFGAEYLDLTREEGDLYCRGELGSLIE